jgi:hypothetical protein
MPTPSNPAIVRGLEIARILYAYPPWQTVLFLLDITHAPCFRIICIAIPDAWCPMAHFCNKVGDPRQLCSIAGR